MLITRLIISGLDITTLLKNGVKGMDTCTPVSHYLGQLIIAHDNQYDIYLIYRSLMSVNT